MFASRPSPHSQTARSFNAVEGGPGRSKLQIKIDSSEIELIKNPSARYMRWLRLANELCEDGYPNDAIDACKSAIAECPERHVGFAMLAVVLMEQSRADRARRLVDAIAGLQVLSGRGFRFGIGTRPAKGLALFYGALQSGVNAPADHAALKFCKSRPRTRAPHSPTRSI